MPTVGAERVVLITSDQVIVREFRDHGVTTVQDRGAGLNAAVALGLAHTPPGASVAALLGDVPALTPADLEHALGVAGTHRQSFVPDADGSGTVLRASSGQDGHFTPRFGPGSAALHAADGAVRLDLEAPRLRTDVDDLRSLIQGAGAGRRTLHHGRSGWPRSAWMGACRPRSTPLTPSR